MKWGVIARLMGSHFFFLANQKGVGECAPMDFWFSPGLGFDVLIVTPKRGLLRLVEPSGFSYSILLLTYLVMNVSLIYR